MDKNTDKKIGDLTVPLKNLLSAPDMVLDRHFQLKNCMQPSQIQMRLALRVGKLPNKFEKFEHPKKIAVIILQFEQCGFIIEYCIQDVDRMANSADPDTTAPSLFAQTCLSDNLGSLQ